MRNFFLLIIIGTILLSCSTGKKAYERGDYYNATLQAVNRLRGNPDSEKAQDALKNSYPMALEYFQDKINYAMNANRPFKYSEIVDYYELMHHMADEISRCPAALKLFPHPNPYDEELASARNNAADEQYTAGMKNEKINTRESWKNAYFNYEQADCFVPGYKDVVQRMETAKYYATWKVIVEPIPVPKAYQLNSDFFLQQVIEKLQNERPNEFVAYYSPESADKAGIKKPDQVLRMSFDEFVIGQTYDKETIMDVSRDSVETGTVKLPDGTIAKVYGTVKARLTVYHREVISNGLLDVSIIDFPLNRVVSERKFPGQFVWFTEWGHFNGDERALSNEQLALCNRTPIPPPRPQDLFVEFTRPIYDQTTSFLKDFYRRY